MEFMLSLYLTPTSDTPICTNSCHEHFREESNYLKNPKYNEKRFIYTLENSFTSDFSLIFKRQLLTVKMSSNMIFLFIFHLITNGGILALLAYLRHLMCLYLLLLNMNISTIHRNYTNLNVLNGHSDKVILICCFT